MIVPAFPSATWFQRLAEAMAAQPERYRGLGSVGLTLVVRIMFRDGRDDCYALTFDETRVSVTRVSDVWAVRGRNTVIIEGEYASWKGMLESMRAHGGIDLARPLDYLTLSGWRLRLVPVDDAEGELDVDRLSRTQEIVQAFFDEASVIETRFAA